MKQLIVSLSAALFVLSISSCSKEIDYSVDGEKNTFFLPQAITPNGDDLNEYYYMIYVGQSGVEDQITSFEIEIKQQGKKLFSATDPAFRWYGKDEKGNPISGKTNVSLSLGINGKSPKKYYSHCTVIREGCVPSYASEYLFPDRIDPRYGAIYNTMETFCP